MIYGSLEATVAKKTVTYDLARQMEGAVEVSCSGFAKSMIESME
jgi:isocitrate dehydrogenase